jgi:hypothetical protein
VRVLRRLLVVALALVVAPSAAGAIVLTVTVTTAGPVTAPGVTLTGLDQTKTFTVASRVTYSDDTGNGGNNLGWKLNVSATAPTVAGRSLPFLIVTGVARANCTNDTTGTACVNPTNNVTWPITVNTTPAKVYNATAPTGKGLVVLTATYQISYPANAIAGTYASTITYAVATGP